MNILSQKIVQTINKNRTRLSVWLLFLLFFVYLTFVFLNRNFFFQSFNSQTVADFLRSQDILDTEDKIKDRIFVSDETIYIASGYLYANGADPREYNFQHTPFIKYLYGFSSLFFSHPLLPNIFLGFILLLEVYLLGKFAFKSEIVGFVASLLMLIDPVFKEVTVYALLDLGQMVFLLGFIITTFFWKKHWIGQGVLLGLAFASKFYSPVIIFTGIIFFYKFLTKDFNLKKELSMLVVSFLTFCSTYMVSFINDNGLFNIFFHQAKIFKFMLDHNSADQWGSVVKMFFGGYYLWPITFFASIFVLLIEKITSFKFLFAFLPVVYLFILCFQLPFVRYFVLIMPFLYLCLGYFISNLNYKSL